MLRSTAVFDLFSMKHLNHHCTMKPSSLSKRSKKSYSDSKSSSHDTLVGAVIPSAMNHFEVTSSFNATYHYVKDAQGAFSLTSIMSIDGPATQALEHSIKMSKRRFTAEKNTPVDGGIIPVPTKRNKRSNNALIAHSNDIPLLNDWNNVYNCLISSVPVDETKPNIMNEPFPAIEYTFDDADTKAYDSVQTKAL